MFTTLRLLHYKFYLKNNTHSSCMSRKSEETMMLSCCPQKAYLQTVLGMLNSTKPLTSYSISPFLSSKWKFIVVDCKQGQLQCPRQCIVRSRKFRKKLKEYSKLYEVYMSAMKCLQHFSTYNFWVEKADPGNILRLK